jgi:hypothetical protein
MHITSESIAVKSFTIGDKVKSLDLCMRVDELKGSFSPERTFLKVCLTGTRFIDLFLFRHVQSIELSYCHCTNITPIAKIPYIKIASCPMLSDFSCLGSQRYLWVKSCYQLTERDVEGNFGGISWLKISHAPQINRLLKLRNKFLEVSHCDALTEVVLEGQNYIRVKLDVCFKLQTVRITGNVYHLLLAYPDKRLDDNSFLNCQNITEL